MPSAKDYGDKRALDQTPEPPPETTGNVDPTAAPAGDTFVIHQHHARSLHFDLRLEMMNGRTPVLVSWAVPKNLPLAKGVKTLAVHVEDHPFEYGKFEGSIPEGQYGAGAVRIFDSGKLEMLERGKGKLTFRLEGTRLKGVWHLVKTSKDWLAMLKEDERPDPDPQPRMDPMLATLAPGPFDDEEWVFEPKWDGIRSIAECSSTTRLVSRNMKDVTVAYPELHDLHTRLVATDALVDGEIVAMKDAAPSFEMLQNRMHVRNPHDIERLRKLIPVTFIAFDLLYIDGKDITRRPFSERRRMLEKAVVPNQSVQVSTIVPGDGIALYEAAKKQNLEGIVAKKAASVYEVGRRSRNWLKIKTVIDADLVVGGWSGGKGNRSGHLGSLLLGAYEEGVLRYVGSVGTGFNAKTLKEMQERLARLSVSECPFASESLRDSRRDVRQASWVDPALVVTVEFRQLTGSGKLRAPSYKGIREDRKPSECTFEELRLAARVGAASDASV